MSATYYRLSKDGSLPTHWSYGDPESDADLQPGFQVWITANQALRALAGEEMDGSYTSQEYPVLLSIVAERAEDGGSLWLAVRPQSVKRVLRIAAVDAVAWVAQQASELKINKNSDLDALRAWLTSDRNQASLERWIKKHSRAVRPLYRRTLGEF